MKKSITEVRHTLGSRIYLDDTWKHANHNISPYITLYPHQQVIVQAMLDLEEKRFLVAKPHKYYSFTTTLDIVIEYNGLVLSEGFGTGKTIEILDFIRRRQIPPSNIIPTRAYSYSAEYKTEIGRKYNTVLRPNIIVVNKSTLLQWRDTIEAMFPEFSFFIIGDAGQLTQFCDMYMDTINTPLNKFDIILAKNGIISNAQCNFTSKSIVDIIATLPLAHIVAWSRVIYDDFDTGILSSATINALFHIYVSSTYKLANKHITQLSVAELIKGNKYRLSDVLHDEILFTNVNVKCDPVFVERSLCLPMISAYKYICKHNTYTRLINLLGDTNGISELLNSDAVSLAAKSLGIKTNNVADLFQYLLYGKQEQLTKYNRLISILRTNLLPYMFARTLQDYSLAEDTFVLGCTTYGPIVQCVQSYLLDIFGSASMEAQLKSLLKKYEQDRDSIYEIINKVKNGLADNTCQICYLPAKDNITLTKCCGTIVCAECVNEVFRFAIKCGKYKTDNNDKQYNVIGKCPNCMSQTDIARDIIFLNGGASCLISTANISPKLQILGAIINGKEDLVRECMYNKSVGKVNIPYSSPIRKIIIFTIYREYIANYLDEMKIQYIYLEGTYTQIYTQVNKFKITENSVILLINSARTCAGINLQMATDVIFFHRAEDVENQIISRAQRIGRKYNLRVHYLLYDTE